MSEIHEKGKTGETCVAQFLQKNGYAIVARNYRVRGGEIDIVARKGDTLAFVEVKTRRRGALVSGEEAITYAKKSCIIKAAERFISDYEEEVNGRFDVAVVETDDKSISALRYYPGAFDASR